MNLEQFYQGTLVVDIAIGFISLEALLLWAFHKWTGRGLALADCMLTIVSGACLMLALRCALTPGGWPGMALFLVAAGVAHGADLRSRWANQPSVDRT